MATCDPMNGVITLALFVCSMQRIERISSSTSRDEDKDTTQVCAAPDMAHVRTQDE
jgi:hypothetical protein